MGSFDWSTAAKKLRQLLDNINNAANVQGPPKTPFGRFLLKKLADRNSVPADCEKAARQLWMILDDIDTGTDMAKDPDPRSDFGRVLFQNLRERHKVLVSDGYELRTPN